MDSLSSSSRSLGEIPSIRHDTRVSYMVGDSVAMLDLGRASSRRASGAVAHDRPLSASRYAMTPRGSVVGREYENIPVRIVIERTPSRHSSTGRSLADSSASKRTVLQRNTLSVDGGQKRRVLRRSVSNLRRRAKSSSSDDDDDIRRRQLSFINETRRSSVGLSNHSNQTVRGGETISQTTSIIVGRASERSIDEIQHEIVVTEFEDANGLLFLLTSIPTTKSFKHNSLYVFGSDNLFRAVVHNVVTSKAFEIFIFANILANCAVMMATDPTQRNRDYEDALDLYFTSVFTLEAITKILALGLVLHEHSYLRESWNVFDAIIVVLSFVNWLPGVANLTALRSVRVLRSLKSVSHFSNLRVVVMSIVKSIPVLANVLTLQFFILSTFAIGGVQLFKGQFSSRCVHTQTRSPMRPETYCRVGNRPGQGVWGYGCPPDYSCVKTGNSYANLLNFDSYPQALSLLFAVMTFDDWPSHYIHSLQTFGELGFIFFFLFIVFAAYVAPNLALAIINDRFITVHDREVLQDAEESSFFARFAKKAVEAVRVNAFEPVNSDGSYSTEQEIQRLTSGDEPPVSNTQRLLAAIGSVQRWCFVVIEGYPKPTCPNEQQEPASTPYRIGLAVCILLNGVLLATLFHGQPEWLTVTQGIANRALTGIFVVDCAFKLFAMGPRLYASQFFNVFDFLISVGSVVELALSGSSIAVVFRTFRLFRLVNLFHNFQHLRKVLRSLMTSLKATAFLNLLIVLYLVIAGLVGMQLFGYSWDSRPIDPNVRASFSSIWGSILIAFQMMTLDGWVPILVHAVSTTSYAAAIYFIISILLGHYVIVNLFKAILIGAFDEEDILEELTKDAVAEEVDSEERHERFVRTLSYQAMHIKKAKFNALSFLKVEELQDMSLPFPMSLNTANRPDTALAPGRVYAVGELEASRRSLSTCLSRSGQGLGDFCRKIRTDISEDEGQEVGEVDLVVPESPFQAYSIPSRERSHCNDSGILPFEGSGPTQLEGVLCEKCGNHMYEPLPPVTQGTHKKAVDLHQRMCEIMRIRKVKEGILFSYKEKASQQKKLGAPTEDFIQEMLGAMWSNGLMLGVREKDLRSESGSPEWSVLDVLINEEFELVSLRIGEEIVGRAFGTHAIKCIPPIRLGWWAAAKDLSREIVTNVWFERLMLICIAASSILVAMDSPRESTKQMRSTLHYIDIGFTGIFAAEMVLKLTALGVYRFGGYFRDPFNWLDALVVIISIVSVSVNQVGFGFLKVLRVFRALRPLRLITRHRSLQVVVLTLFKSTKGVLSVCCIVLLNLSVFGILGLHLFSGSFQRCSDASVTSRQNCTGAFIVDSVSNVTAERRWMSAPRNFDNFGRSLLTLFEVSTLEWWTDVMWDCVDSVSPDQAPVRDRNVWYTFVFLLFVILSSFVFFQLFVAVMMSSFMKVQASLGGLSFVTPEQRMWGEAQRILLRYEPSAVMFPLDNPICRRLFVFMNSQFVELFLYFLVCLNVGLMCVDYLGRPVRVTEAWGILNDTMSGFFISKFVLLFGSIGPRYFLDPWNRLDVFLASSTITNIVLRETTTIDVSILQVFYILRLLRVLRILKRFKGIRILFEVVLYSLGALFNVGMLMLVLMFLFAVMGMQLFSNIDTGMVIDAGSTNFFNFWNSFRMMFRFITLADWNKVMHDCMVRPPLCDNSDPTQGNCGTEAAPIFFVLYVVFAVYVLSNLLTASILDNFNIASQMERSELHFNDIQRFLSLWSSKDKDASMIMDTRHFYFLASRLRPPMGFVRTTSKVDFLRLCERYNIPDHGGKIHFLETLIPMSRYTLGVHLPADLSRLQERAWRDANSSIARLPVVRLFDGTVGTVTHFFACLTIQSAFRRRAAMLRVRRLRATIKSTVSEHERYTSLRVPAVVSSEANTDIKYSTTLVVQEIRRSRGALGRRLQNIWNSHEEEEDASNLLHAVGFESPDPQNSTLAFSAHENPIDLLMSRRVAAARCTGDEEFHAPNQDLPDEAISIIAPEIHSPANPNNVLASTQKPSFDSSFESSGEEASKHIY